MRRWYIPAAFLLLTVTLFGAVNLIGEEVIIEDELAIAKDRPWSGAPIELQGGTTYNFTVSPQAMCKGCQSQVRVELFRDIEPVLELDTTFESDDTQLAGTVVTLDFEPPVDDHYQPRFSLLSSNGGGERLTFTVKRKPLLPLASWPLGVGLLLFLTLTAWTWAGADSELLEALSKLGAGTRLTIFGAPGIIETVTEFREEGYPPGIEYEVRMDDGSIRYLALDRFEEEGYDHDTVYHLLLFSQPLDASTLEQLDQQGPDVLVRAIGEAWRLDENNSGEVRTVIYKVGSVFQSTQDVRVYCPYQKAFPKHAGDRVLEHIDYRDGDTEWALMRIVSPADVEILEAVEHESVSDMKLNELAQLSRDARAARDRRDAAAVNQPQNQAQPQQEQQWAQKPFGDGHG